MKYIKWLGGFLRPQRDQLAGFILGGLAVFAFAPFKFSPIILLSLAGLFLLWLKAETPRDAAKTGLWFGLGLFGFGVSWLFSSIYFYAEVVLPLAILLTFGFVFYLSLFTALAGWLSQYVKSTPLLALGVGFPAIWVFVELLRSWVFGGFPFLTSGASQLHSALDGYAPILGVWGMSLAVAVSAGLLVAVFKFRQWILASSLLAIIWLGGMGLKQVQWVQPVGEPIDIALLQGNIAQDKKWLEEAFLPTLKTYVSLTKQNMDADVIVWPETAVAHYYSAVERGALRSFIKDAQLFNKDILLGVIDSSKDSDDYYNAIVNAGNPEDRYYKHHLVPFSEYFPFDGAFRFVSGLFDIPYATFSAGPSEPQPMMAGGAMAGLSVCFETSFGEELARLLPEAKYMITVSNDAWFAHTFEPAQQLEDVQVRALELGREFARATNTGITAIVDTRGNIKSQIAPYEVGALRGQVQPYDGMTPYAEWKKLPIYLIIGLMVMLAFWKARKTTSVS